MTKKNRFVAYERREQWRARATIGDCSNGLRPFSMPSSSAFVFARFLENFDWSPCDWCGSACDTDRGYSFSYFALEAVKVMTATVAFVSVLSYVLQKLGHLTVAEDGQC